MIKSKEDRDNNGNIHPKRIFKTPEDLLKAWNEYKEHVTQQAKDWIKIQYVGKEGAKKMDEQRPPFTMEGFEVFCYKNYGCVNHYFDNKEGYYTDFGTVCRAIKQEIRENQIIGGMLGFYNPSITQRLNGLTDRQDLTTKGESLTNQPPTIEVYNSAPKLASSEDDIEE